MTEAAVTGAFAGSVYVESTDRSSGLKVLTGQSIAPNTLVQVTGTLDTDALERIVRYGDVTALGTFNVKALGMNASALTGSAEDGGPATIPLLVRVCGRVTARDDSSWFTVDDGSGRTDWPGNAGIKVSCSWMTPPALDAFVMVTGISSFEWAGGATFPVVRARSSGDVQHVP